MKTYDLEFTTRIAEVDGRRRERAIELTHTVEVECRDDDTGTLTWDVEREDGLTEDRRIFDFTYDNETCGIGFDADADLSELFEHTEFREWFDKQWFRRPHWSISEVSE